MPRDIAPSVYEKIRKHIENGIPLQYMNLTEAQKHRVELCTDAYQRFATDPYMNLDNYLKRKWGRTMDEIRIDKKVINFIAGFYDVGQRNISKMKVIRTSELLMKTGVETGNTKAMKDGADLLMKVERLDQPETPQMGEDMAQMPILMTGDLHRKDSKKKSSTSEEMARIRKKYGVKMDEWQEMVEVKTGEYAPADPLSEEEEESEEEEKEMPYPSEEEDE
ncbi:hypothetical protein [uncultured Bacteroides sp.]|uniref:hypothetical protein n=1 Tax=uncultured Bacteroides sp. TaxID=162156 RepID=UPI00263973AA|nr:hypothetical protein [uncultured Bacteroides sp.]